MSEPTLEDFTKELMTVLLAFNAGWAESMAIAVEHALAEAKDKAARRRLLTSHSEKGDVR